MEKFDEKGLEEKLDILNDINESNYTIPWNKDIRYKILILIPLVFALVGLIVFNDAQSIKFLLGTAFLCMACILLGLLIYLFMGRY